MKEVLQTYGANLWFHFWGEKCPCYDSLNKMKMDRTFGPRNVSDFEMSDTLTQNDFRNSIFTGLQITFPVTESSTYSALRSSLEWQLQLHSLKLSKYWISSCSSEDWTISAWARGHKVSHETYLKFLSCTYEQSTDLCILLYAIEGSALWKFVPAKKT